MFKLLQQIDRTKLVLFLFTVIISALIYSPFLLSVGMIGLAIVFTFSIDWGKPGWLRLNPNFFRYFRRFFKSQVHLVMTFFFLLVLVSGVMTEDWGYWWNRLQMKLPFLVLPIIFCGLPKLSQRAYWGVFYFLTVALTITCIGILINYLLHLDDINTVMKQGQPMPTPRNHIRFSLLLALGTVATFFLWQQRFRFKYTWEPAFMLGAGIFLLGMLHLLSVRSGLAALYLAIIILGVQFVLQTRKYWVGIVIGTSMLVLPILAYYTIPSFQAKIAYVKYEFWIRENKLSGNYSDLGRIISLQIGLDIGNEHPIFGVGAGNLRQEVRARYAAQYPDVKEIRMPHNQLVSVYAGTGIVGLLVFLFAFFFPLFFSWKREMKRRKIKTEKPAFDFQLFLALHVIVFASFMVENTIENSIGVGFYTFFLLLGLQKQDTITHNEWFLPDPE
ncbi:MAG: O-antigen ligase family protein [Saprospiraceae bacterium]